MKHWRNDCQLHTFALSLAFIAFCRYTASIAVQAIPRSMAASPQNQDQHQFAVEAFLEKLRTFLSAPNHQGQGDGWPVISVDELADARQLADEMFALKWGVDGDGDSPVRHSLFDKARHRIVWDCPLFVDPQGEESPQAKEERLLRNLSAITGATSAYGHALGVLQRELATLRGERLARAAAFEVFLVSYVRPEDWANPLDRPVSLHLTKDAADAFEPQGYVRTGVSSMWTQPTPFDNPEDDFVAYRGRVESACGRVAPLRAGLAPFRLTKTRPLEA